MSKRKPTPKNPNRERWGVGPAAGAQMSRTFTDRKKAGDKNACRGAVKW